MPNAIRLPTAVVSSPSSSPAQPTTAVVEIPPAAAAGTGKRIPDIHELQLENEIAAVRSLLGTHSGRRR